jgi:hypothetical protein
MMTHDEFGPHLVKNPQLVLTKFSDKEILSSSYMFYSVILKFEANAIVDNIVSYPTSTRRHGNFAVLLYRVIINVCSQRAHENK